MHFGKSREASQLQDLKEIGVSIMLAQSACAKRAKGLLLFKISRGEFSPVLIHYIVYNYTVYSRTILCTRTVTCVPYSIIQIYVL